MPEWEPLLTAARQLLALGEPAMFATLIGTEGPTYRPPGAHMLAAAGLSPIGGISGGCLEDYVAREGLKLATANTPAVLSFDTTHDPDDPRPVPGCGGQLHVLIERLSPNHLALLESITAARTNDQPAILTTEARGYVPDQTTINRRLQRLATPHPSRRTSVPPVSPSKPNARSTGILPPTPSPTAIHCFDPLDAATESAAAQKRTFQTRPANSHWLLARYITPPIRLVVLGAGDDAMALVRQAKLLGWHATVVDRRTRLANRDRFPTADAILAEPWSTALPKIPESSRSALITMTHSVPDDADILPWALTQPAAFTGILGPVSRREVVLKELTVRGTPIAPEMLHGLHSPVGLDLGEKTPEAIALAIAAEILAVTNARTAAPLSKPA